MPTGRILHYQILERLGAGAMGEVYLAEDTRLDRRVVLKFLSLRDAGGDDERPRLEREARALAALSHPHIARVLALETGAETPFLVMEHVDGETLAEVLSLGPLAPPEVAHVGASIAGALAHAHGRGVVHRDIKPENILVTEDGHVRLADFGVASLRDTSTSEPEAMVWGTPEYMSPEQARGEPTDGRCDQYALGVVLIEALTGEAPRPDEDPAAALARLREPVDAALSRPATELERVLMRCVERDPGRRHPDAAALHAALSRVARELDGRGAPPARRMLSLLLTASLIGALALAVLWWTVLRPRDGRSGGVPAVRSVAVASVVVRGGSASDAYVGKAFAEAVVVGLSRAPNLTVRMIADSAIDRRTVREDLLVQGRIVREHGTNHARLSVTDVRGARVLWAGTRDAEDGHLPYLARAFSDDIARALHVPPTPLYDFYLYAITSPSLGRSPVASAALGALRRDDVTGGMRWARELVERFPREPEAHVLYAYCLLGRDWATGQNAADRQDLMNELDRLRAVDPESPWATVFEGLMLHRMGRVADAERSFGRVLERDDLTPAARGFVLSLRGQARRDLDETTAALADLDEASRLDPTNVITLVIHADALGLAGHADEGLVRARQAIALDPDANLAIASMYQCLARLGRWTEAIPYAELACHRTPDAMTLASSATILRHAGRRDEAEAQLRLAEAATESDWGDYQLSRYHALAGHPARALALLRAAARRGYADPEVLRAPEFDPYRSDPEFRAIVAGLRQHWVPAPALTPANE